jgi:RNA polymerase subunit RPABC4/transcription elongation factor Spt4
MKKYKKVQVPATMRDVLDYIQCDICGKTSNTNWKKDVYDVEKIEIRRRTGVEYPDRPLFTTTTIDMCPECFVSKLIPWVESHGGTPTVEHYDG